MMEVVSEMEQYNGLRLPMVRKAGNPAGIGCLRDYSFLHMMVVVLEAEESETAQHNDYFLLLVYKSRNRSDTGCFPGHILHRMMEEESETAQHNGLFLRPQYSLDNPADTGCFPDRKRLN